MKIAVAGTGYVGLVTGVVFAHMGHDVTCVDVDEKKIEIMRKGISPIYEEGLEELMQKNAERLTYTTEYKTAYKEADVIFVGVGTPEKRDGSANLSYVKSVCTQIAESIERDCVVVIKSTVPIGTNDKIEQMINKLAPEGINIDIVSNPEFLAQGTAVRDTINASRIVIGTETERARLVMEKVYENFDQPIVFTNRRSAEMIKYASNDFLALKISYINEIANLCEILGADIEDVSRGMGFDTRIGNKFLNAGIGYGGSCFPKDTKALHWVSNVNEREIKTVKAAIEVNDMQKLKLLKKARQYYESFDGLTVAVLGLTFKPNTDDLREAPSLVNVPALVDEGAKVKAFDPVGVENFKKIITDDITYCDTVEETLKDADICFIFTEWADVVNLDIEKFRLMKKPIVLDGRNCFKLEKFEGTGIVYNSIGRRTVE